MDRINHSIENLLNIIAKTNQEKTILSGLIHQLLTIKGGPDLIGTFCDVLITQEEIPDYLGEFYCSYLILVIPNNLPVVALDRADIDGLLEKDEMVTWLANNWQPGAIAIMVP